VTRPSAAHKQPATNPPTGRPPRRDPIPLTRREVGFLTLIWTVAIGGWFAITLVNGNIGGTALVLAVGGGLFGAIWLLGLLILGLFLVGAE